MNGEHEYPLFDANLIYRKQIRKRPSPVKQGKKIYNGRQANSWKV
jgi:hypothetical protein